MRGKGGMRAGDQAPRGLETQASLPVAAQPRLSLSPNFHTSRTSRSMAFLKLSAPSRLSVLGFRWALPEGVKGSSLSQGLGGDSGASLRPVGEAERMMSGWKEKGRTLSPPGQCLKRPSWDPSPAAREETGEPLLNAGGQINVSLFSHSIVHSLNKHALLWAEDKLDPHHQRAHS